MRGLHFRVVRPGPVWGFSRPLFPVPHRIVQLPDKRSGPVTGRLEKLLFAKTQFLDQCVVALYVFLLEIGEQAAALIDHLQETTT